MQDKIDVFISEKEIASTVKRLAEQIGRDYEGKNLVCVCVLKGATLFAADLFKSLSIPAEIDFVKVSSYGKGKVSSGMLNFSLDIKRDNAAEYDLLFIEDIIDSGRTMKLLIGLFQDRGYRSVKSASLLDKPSRRINDYNPDYVGITIEDRFVVGYGLDCDEKYRNLPYIGVLD